MRTMQHIRTHTMYAPLPGCVKKVFFAAPALFPPLFPADSASQKESKRSILQGAGKNCTMQSERSIVEVGVDGEV